MKLSHLFLIASLLWGTGVLRAQSFQGIVRSADDHSTVAYVNIGVLHKDQGTVSDASGNFRLPLDGVSDNDSIRVSCIGYQPVILLVGEANTGMTIELQPIEHTLDEVVIVPVDYKDKIVGNPNTPANMQAGFSENKLGYEMGVLMKCRRKPAYIDEIKIEIANCTYDTIFYRLNIYEMDGKRPGRNLLREPIYLTYTQEEVEEELTINIRDQYIRVEGDFVVSLELVRDLGEGKLMLQTGMMNNPTFYRETSQGDWNKIRFGVGISAKIRQEE